MIGPLFGPTQLGNAFEVLGTEQTPILGSTRIELLQQILVTMANRSGGGGGGGTGTVTSVSVATANGVSGVVATPTTTPVITLTLGAITPTSVNGLTLAAQAVGFTIAGGTTSKTLTVSNTLALAGVDGSTLTIPATGTAALLGVANVFSAANTFNVNGAASTPAVQMTGTWFTGGSASTTQPVLSIQPTGTSWANGSTNGTGLGINAASGFNGNIIGIQTNNQRWFSVSGGGTIMFSGSFGNTYFDQGGDNRWRMVSAFGCTNYFQLQDSGGSSSVYFQSRDTDNVGLGLAGGSPSAQTLGGTQGMGANITGGSLNFGTRGTGTGTSGSINFQTHTAGASSSTLGTLATMMSVNPDGINFNGLTAASDAALVSTHSVTMKVGGLAYKFLIQAL